MKTIRVPLDGSALAEQALPYAQMLAAQVGARVHLLRVIGDSEGDVARLSEPAPFGRCHSGLPTRTALQRAARAPE